VVCIKFFLIFNFGLSLIMVLLLFIINKLYLYNIYTNASLQQLISFVS
jgi:hypothetical protein